jgi:hypothetical protein
MLIMVSLTVVTMSADTTRVETEIVASVSVVILTVVRTGADNAELTAVVTDATSGAMASMGAVAVVRMAGGCAVIAIPASAVAAGETATASGTAMLTDATSGGAASIGRAAVADKPSKAGWARDSSSSRLSRARFPRQECVLRRCEGRSLIVVSPERIEVRSGAAGATRNLVQLVCRIPRNRLEGYRVMWYSQRSSQGVWQ